MAAAVGSLADGVLPHFTRAIIVLACCVTAVLLNVATLRRRPSVARFSQSRVLSMAWVVIAGLLALGMLGSLVKSALVVESKARVVFSGLEMGERTGNRYPVNAYFRNAGQAPTQNALFGFQFRMPEEPLTPEEEGVLLTEAAKAATAGQAVFKKQNAIEPGFEILIPIGHMKSVDYWRFRRGEVDLYVISAVSYRDASMRAGSFVSTEKCSIFHKTVEAGLPCANVGPAQKP